MFLKFVFGSTIFILINSIIHKYSSKAYPATGTGLEIQSWTLKNCQKITISPAPSFSLASLVYLMAFWFLITFPDCYSCLFLAYPLLFTIAFSHSSVKLIPNPWHLIVPLASISQTLWSQDHFTLLKIIEDGFVGCFYIYCMTK